MTKSRVDIVESALQELKVVDFVDGIDSNHEAVALAALNQFLAEGRTIGKAVIPWLEASDDVIPESVAAQISLALAGRLATKFYSDDKANGYIGTGLRAEAMLVMLLDAPLVLRRDTPRAV